MLPAADALAYPTQPTDHGVTHGMHSCGGSLQRKPPPPTLVQKKNDAILLKIMTTTVPTRKKNTHTLIWLATLAPLTLAASSATRESTNERVRQWHRMWRRGWLFRRARWFCNGSAGTIPGCTPVRPPTSRAKARVHRSHLGFIVSIPTTTTHTDWVHFCLTFNHGPRNRVGFFFNSDGFNCWC